MTVPAELAAYLPRDLVRAWERIVPAVPPVAYLAGGTAITVHLLHRVSRDLDFFTTGPFDPGRLEAELHDLGTFARTAVDDGTLNGVFEDTKVQFLEASSQRVLEGLTDVGGLRIAGLGDLLATKLKVLADRGELRDYFDIWRIETEAGRRIEEGLALFLARYGADENAVLPIVRALGSLDDVADDPFLPVGRDEIVSWFRARQPQVAVHLDRTASD